MKRISPATVTFGVMAIVLGLVAAFVVRQSLRKAPVAAAPAPPPPGLVGVVIANKNIPINAQITLADMTVVNVPPGHTAIQTSVKHPANAMGRIAKQVIRAGQVVREEYLLGIGESLPDLAERIPSGHRAVTINVEGANTGGKRVTEGDFVDIALTVEGDHPDLGEVQTRTLLKNVMVVDAAVSEPLKAATGTRNSRLAGQGNDLTVAVTEADANRLIVAERTGTLSVTLCSAKDQNNLADDTTISRRELLALREIPPPPLPEPPPVIAPAPPPKVYRIESYVGGSRQVLEMSEERINESIESSKYVVPGDITEPVSKERPEDWEEHKERAVRKISPFAQATLPN